MLIKIQGPKGAVREADVRGKYRDLTRRLIERGRTITTMESCTGGMIASLITDTEGSSAVLPGAFVTYSNDAKIQMGVPADMIRQFGVYSHETACAMAEVCRAIYGTDIGVGVTGSFGNVDPNNADSIPGEVYFAIAWGGTEDASMRSGNCDGYHCRIPEQPSRQAYKLYMAELIADRLLALSFISGEYTEGDIPQ